MRTITLFFVTLLIAGCTGSSGQTGEIQDVFDQYCDAMHAEDAGGLMDLTTADQGSRTYEQSVAALDIIFSRYDVARCSVTVQDVSVDAGTASVQIQEQYTFTETDNDGSGSSFQPPSSGTRTVTLKQVDGSWLIAPEQR